MLAAILATRGEPPPPEPVVQVWQPGFGEIYLRNPDSDGRRLRFRWRQPRRRFPWSRPR